MRKVSCAAALAMFGATLTAAKAETLTLNQNQTGFNLPGVTIPGGHDEVRAADGTTCRSAVANAGPYLDVGAVGNQRGGSLRDGAIYGRFVVPLGRRGGRLDCKRLYELEVQRLETEVRLLRAGLGSGGGAPAGGSFGAPPPAIEGLSGESAVPVPRRRGGASIAAGRSDVGNWTETAFSD